VREYEKEEERERERERAQVQTDDVFATLHVVLLGVIA
jgi:hypothetical protein